jgi:hypothetical protein
MNPRLISRRGLLNSTAGLTAGLTCAVAPLDARAALGTDAASMLTYRRTTGGLGHGRPPARPAAAPRAKACCSASRPKGAWPGS